MRDAERRTGTYRDDWFAERYLQHWEPVLARPAIELLDLVESSGLAPGAGTTVVDIGAGAGLLTLEIARRWPSTRTVAADPARAMLEQVRARALGEGIGGDRIELVEATADALPLPDRSAALVVSSFVLQVVPDRPAALREARRVLADGRWLGYVTWLETDRTFAPAVAVDEELGSVTNTDWGGGAPRAGDIPSLAAAEAELREAGFDEVRISTGELREPWTREGYLDHLEGCRNTVTFAGLDEGGRAELRARLRGVLETLPSDAFVQRATVVVALARRG